MRNTQQQMFNRNILRVGLSEAQYIERLKTARRRRKLTQKHMAAILFMHENSYQMRENGNRKFQDSEKSKIKKLFGKEVDQ